MHRVLTVMPKLSSPCRAEYIVPHTPQTPLHVEQTKGGRQREGGQEREREREGEGGGGGGRGGREGGGREREEREGIYKGSMVVTISGGLLPRVVLVLCILWC